MARGGGRLEHSRPGGECEDGGERGHVAHFGLSGLRVRTAAARTGELALALFADGDADDVRAVTGYRAERGPVLEKSDMA